MIFNPYDLFEYLSSVLSGWHNFARFGLKFLKWCTDHRKEPNFFKVFFHLRIIKTIIFVFCCLAEILFLDQSLYQSQHSDWIGNNFNSLSYFEISNNFAQISRVKDSFKLKVFIRLLNCTKLSDITSKLENDASRIRILLSITAFWDSGYLMARDGSEVKRKCAVRVVCHHLVVSVLEEGYEHNWKFSNSWYSENT